MKENMHFRNAALCETLSQYKKIIIYGTGDFARKIYPKLVQYGLKKKIVCFTQTNESNMDFFYGIPVVNIKALSYKQDECVVLIATSHLYVDEIKQTLLEYKYLNVVSLVDYILYYQRFAEDYRYLTTFEEYCEYIADWYVRVHRGNLDINMVVQELLNKSKDKNDKMDDNLVVIICGFLSARITKIIGALKRKKYNIVMLEYYGPVNFWYVNTLQSMDIPIYHCEHVAEMLYYALQYHPLVYFFEPRWGDCLWTEIMLKNKQYFGKIVLTLYDILNYGFIGIEESKLMLEKDALEHADGIVWRYFSKEYLEEKGFRYQGKSIHFLDYCSHQDMNTMPEALDSSVIKLCVTVGYGDEYLEDRAYDVKCDDLARIGEILEKIGNRQDCIFHFYAGAIIDNKNITRCEQYERQYKNFRFFLGTEYNELMEKLKYYDFGCDLFIDGEISSDDIPVGPYYSSIMINSVCNKHFDFLSVGLPIIATRPLKVCEYLDAYGVVVKMDLSTLDIDYLKQHKEYYKEKVKEAKKALDIDNHISRLIEFFKEV